MTSASPRTRPMSRPPCSPCPSSMGAVGSSAVMLTLLGLVLAACDPVADVGERLGLWLDAGGQPVVEYARCSNELVTLVRLGIVDETTGPQSSRTIWEIVANSDSTIDRFTVGVAPAGFTERVPLKTPLSSSTRYVVKVNSTGQKVASNVFGMSELRSGRVLTSFKDEYLPLSAFRDRSRDICNG